MDVQSKIELYHNSNSTCSQKVRLALAARQVEFESREIDILSGEQFSAAYIAINPAAVVPVLVVDGVAITESSVINEYINDATSGASMLPEDPVERALDRSFIKFIDDEVHLSVGKLTLATALRQVSLARPEGEVRAEIAKAKTQSERHMRTSLFEKGVEAPEVFEGLGVMFEFLDRLSKRIESRAVVQELNLVDCAALPYVLRASRLRLIESQVDRFRNVADWLQSVMQTEAYGTAVGAWESEMVHDLFAISADLLSTALQSETVATVERTGAK